MGYADVVDWTRLVDIIENRVSIINQIMGARYDSCLDNPCILRYRRGEYVCTYCGETYATWHVYDLDTTRRAFERIDALSDALWLAFRTGRMSYTWPTPTTA